MEERGDIRGQKAILVRASPGLGRTSGTSGSGRIVSGDVFIKIFLPFGERPSGGFCLSRGAMAALPLYLELFSPARVHFRGMFSCVVPL